MSDLLPFWRKQGLKKFLKKQLLIIWGMRLQSWPVTFLLPCVHLSGSARFLPFCLAVERLGSPDPHLTFPLIAALLSPLAPLPQHVSLVQDPEETLGVGSTVWLGKVRHFSRWHLHCSCFPPTLNSLLSVLCCFMFCHISLWDLGILPLEVTFFFF